MKLSDYIFIFCSSSLYYSDIDEGIIYIYKTDEFIDDKFVIGVSVELN